MTRDRETGPGDRIGKRDDVRDRPGRLFLVAVPAGAEPRHAGEDALEAFGDLRIEGEPALDDRIRRELVDVLHHALLEFVHHRGLHRLDVRKAHEFAGFERGAARDWSRLHAALALIEPGEWTTYGDLAEEWAIHDHDGFGELRLSELESLEYVAGIAGGIEKHGLAFAAWASEVNSDPEQRAQFEERFQGEWESVEAYAENLLDEMSAQKVIDDAPEWLRPYLKLDVAGFSRDLEAGGDIATAETDEGRVWVWLGR